MMKGQKDQDTALREKMIHRYIQALDRGDIDGVAAVLETALDDPELDRVIAEINFALQEEEQLTPTAADAQLVRGLLRKHLPSAFYADEPDEKPLTVGDVAARLQADRRVPPADQEVNRLLLSSSVTLPTWLSAQAISRLITELGITASDRFLRAFRDTAIMLGMGHSHNQAQLAAAREERARYTTLEKRDQASRPASRDTDSEEDE
jgi:hypothetical protein